MSHTRDWSSEVCYQVFVRSFRDGNGDGIGDFRGLMDGLDYLQALGITALWLNPVFPSPTHHNYFTTEFFETDPDYGTRQEFADLCRAVHRRGMKILLDMETQYLPDAHPWFQAARRDPASPMRRRFLFRDDDPDDWLCLRFNMPLDDRLERIALEDLPLLNLADQDVVDFQHRIYRFWLDPVGSGDPADGVDGFRLDHVMDDLDHYGVLTGLLDGFWRPLIGHVRERRPDAFFLAEPADWASFDNALIVKGGLDACFAIPLMFAIREMSRDRLTAAIEHTLAGTPAGHRPFLILENHDVTRFATAVDEHPGRERIGAVLNLTLPGVPTLYYGQEIGMTGRIGSPDFDMHIPAREAFRWSPDIRHPGMAVWYREHRFWPMNGITRDDGRTLTAQRADPHSLWHHYRKLIRLRQRSAALRRGRFEFLDAGHPDVLAYRREHADECVTVVLNLSDSEAVIDRDALVPRRSTETGGPATAAGLPDGTLMPWAAEILEIHD